MNSFEVLSQIFNAHFPLARASSAIPLCINQVSGRVIWHRTVPNTHKYQGLKLTLDLLISPADLELHCSIFPRPQVADTNLENRCRCRWSLTYQKLISFAWRVIWLGWWRCHSCGHGQRTDGLVHVQKLFVRHLHYDSVSEIMYIKKCVSSEAPADPMYKKAG